MNKTLKVLKEIGIVIVGLFLIIAMILWVDTFATVNMILSFIALYSLYLSIKFKERILIKHDNGICEEEYCWNNTLLHVFWFIGFPNVFTWYVWYLVNF